jgi:hypothetical protein
VAGVPALRFGQPVIHPAPGTEAGRLTVVPAVGRDTSWSTETSPTTAGAGLVSAFPCRYEPAQASGVGCTPVNGCRLAPVPASAAALQAVCISRLQCLAVIPTGTGNGLTHGLCLANVHMSAAPSPLNKGCKPNTHARHSWQEPPRLSATCLPEVRPTTELAPTSFPRTHAGRVWFLVGRRFPASRPLVAGASVLPPGPVRRAVAGQRPPLSSAPLSGSSRFLSGPRADYDILIEIRRSALPGEGKHEPPADRLRRLHRA